jgi:sodium transport system permease protein
VTVRAALGTYLACVAALLAMGPWLARFGLAGLAASELLALALPTVLMARATGDRLGWVRPPARAVAGAVLVGASGWAVLAEWILPLQEAVAKTPKALEEGLAQAIAGPTWAVLGAVALVPAVCEELLCRGALAFAIRRRAPAAVAVLASAFLFALLHGSVYRLVPTFLLGVVLGAIALRAGSIVPSMVAHAVNNACIVLVADAPDVSATLDAHAAVVGGVAVIGLTCGSALVFLRFRDMR